MKVFAMNDYDWWVGENLESCIAGYIEVVGEPDSICDAFELLGSDLHDLQICYEDESGNKVRHSFERELEIQIEKGGQFPRFFASLEQ